METINSLNLYDEKFNITSIVFVVENEEFILNPDLFCNEFSYSTDFNHDTIDLTLKVENGFSELLRILEFNKVFVKVISTSNLGSTKQFSMNIKYFNIGYINEFAKLKFYGSGICREDYSINSEKYDYLIKREYSSME